MASSSSGEMSLSICVSICACIGKTTNNDNKRHRLLDVSVVTESKAFVVLISCCSPPFFFLFSGANDPIFCPFSQPSVAFSYLNDS